MSGWIEHTARLHVSKLTQTGQPQGGDGAGPGKEPRVNGFVKISVMTGPQAQVEIVGTGRMGIAACGRLADSGFRSSPTIIEPSFVIR